MTRILAVVGSPRKNGNTHILVSRFLDGARAAGAQVDLAVLTDLHIKECDGCHTCWQGSPCCKNDDMLGLYPRIIAADIIVFGTPVYWFGPTALMKAFIDRLVYFNSPENRGLIRGKSAVLIVPFEDDDPETARLVVEFFEKSLEYLEIKLIAKLIVPGVGSRGDVLHKPQFLDEAFNLGQKLSASG
jgi:multimeric flavodoxin WrbA